MAKSAQKILMSLHLNIFLTRKGRCITRKDFLSYVQPVAKLFFLLLICVLDYCRDIAVFFTAI